MHFACVEFSIFIYIAVYSRITISSTKVLHGFVYYGSFNTC